MANIFEDAVSQQAPDGPSPMQAVMTDAQVRELEKENMLNALRIADWRVSGPQGAAQLLGVKPTTFTDRMRKYSISRPRAGAA
jgi:transcriptional regulator with GAF, ATPase, and Fis domain